MLEGSDRLRTLDGQLRLFAAGGVLVDHALGGSFIDRAHGVHIRLFGRGLIAGLQRLVIAADGGLERRLDHAVAQVLLLSHLDPLHGGLDVCQIIHPLCAEYKFLPTIILTHAQAKCKRNFRRFARIPALTAFRCRKREILSST